MERSLLGCMHLSDMDTHTHRWLVNKYLLYIQLTGFSKSVVALFMSMMYIQHRAVQYNRETPKHKNRNQDVLRMSCTMSFCLFLDMCICFRRVCGSWGFFIVFCWERSRLQTIWGNSVILQIKITLSHLAIWLSVYLSPSLQGSQGSSTSLSSAKVSSSVEDSDGLVTEGEQSVSEQRRCTCKYHACLNHVHDLWCISFSLAPISAVFV